MSCASNSGCVLGAPSPRSVGLFCVGDGVCERPIHIPIFCRHRQRRQGCMRCAVLSPRVASPLFFPLPSALVRRVAFATRIAAPCRTVTVATAADSPWPLSLPLSCSPNAFLPLYLPPSLSFTHATTVPPWLALSSACCCCALRLAPFRAARPQVEPPDRAGVVVLRRPQHQPHPPHRRHRWIADPLAGHPPTAPRAAPASHRFSAIPAERRWSTATPSPHPTASKTPPLLPRSTMSLPAATLPSSTTGASTTTAPSLVRTAIFCNALCVMVCDCLCW